METTYFRKGFGLKEAIAGQLGADYHSGVVDLLRARDYALDVGPLSFRLARQFGFCYGVDRAVDYAYETRIKFPDRRLFLVGEIIHNPHVNRKLQEMGIASLSHGPDGEFDFGALTAEDVVIMPAFGVTMRDFERLRAIGCVMVDTTCGSVLNVWKRVDGYARDGFTAIIHGKYYHEETKATASQTLSDGGNGKYLILRNLKETGYVTDFIVGRMGAEELTQRLAHGMCPGFDPEEDLQRVGVANQTTMLMSETMAVGEELRKAMAERYGAENIAEHFELFDTICSATQDRQDALFGLLENPLDLMVVIGGYNSSNTNNLAIIADERVPRSYHIASGDCIDGDTIRHKPAHTPLDSREEIEESGWLPEGPVRIGLTAGASTPNSQIGLAIGRILEARRLPPEIALA
jgi:4-hydroxy-3-methylbut-2-en-1-yl diphosphate reductase